MRVEESERKGKMVRLKIASIEFTVTPTSNGSGLTGFKKKLSSFIRERTYVFVRKRCNTIYLASK